VRQQVALVVLVLHPGAAAGAVAQQRAARNVASPAGRGQAGGGGAGRRAAWSRR